MADSTDENNNLYAILRLGISYLSYFMIIIRTLFAKKLKKKRIDPSYILTAADSYSL